MAICISCGSDQDADATVCPVCGLGCITGPHDAFVAFCEASQPKRRRIVWPWVLFVVAVVIGLIVGSALLWVIMALIAVLAVCTAIEVEAL